MKGYFWIFENTLSAVTGYSSIKYMFRTSDFEHINRLYNPLREALQRTQVQSPQVELARSRAYNQMGRNSRISKRMRSMSPQQTEQLTRSTFISQDKQLVPTNNLWKVRDKKFTAVNIQVKQGHPVPPQQLYGKFGNSRSSLITTETLYQMRPRHNIHSSNHSPAYRLSSPPPPPKFENSYRIQQPQPVYFNNTFQQQRNNVQKVASPVRLIERQAPQFSQYQLNSPLKNYSGSPKADLDRISTDFRPSQQKSSYKYNLFSSFDEAINTGCGSCGANQIIATKPNTYWQ